MSDYVILYKVQNARLKRAIRSAGFRNVNDLCVTAGLCPSAVGEILNLKKPPTNKNGTWRKVVVQMCDALGTFPEELFTEQQRTVQIKTNAGAVELTEREALALANESTLLDWQLAGSGDPALTLEQEEMNFDRLLTIVQSDLTSDQAQAVKLHFNEGLTYEEIAQRIHVAPASVQGVLQSALRKMRHPKHQQALLDNLP